MARRQGLRPGLRRAAAKRAIQKAVQDPLAELILSGKVKDGETVKVSVAPGKKALAFNGEAAAKEAA